MTNEECDEMEALREEIRANRRWFDGEMARLKQMGEDLCREFEERRAITVKKLDLLYHRSMHKETVNLLCPHCRQNRQEAK